MATSKDLYYKLLAKCDDLVEDIKELQADKTALIVHNKATVTHAATHVAKLEAVKKTLITINRVLVNRIVELEAYIIQLKTERNEWQERWTGTETERINIRTEHDRLARYTEDLEAIITKLQEGTMTIVHLLELGSVQLIAINKLCGEKDVVKGLSPEELRELYLACLKVAVKVEGRE